MKHGPNDQTLWQVYSLKSNYWRDLQVEMPNHVRRQGWQDTGYAVSFMECVIGGASKIILGYMCWYHLT
jgi:hypothetical protein